AETKAALRKHPSDLDAWDHMLRGLWHLNQFRQGSNAEARRELLAALERDPSSAQVCAWLALTHVFDAWFNWTKEHSTSLGHALEASSAAVKADPQEPAAYVASAMANFWNGRLEQANVAADRAVALNPNTFLGNFMAAGTRNYLGECEAAISYHVT